MLIVGVSSVIGVVYGLASNLMLCILVLDHFKGVQFWF